MKGFTFTNIYIWRDLFWRNFPKKGYFRTAIQTPYILPFRTIIHTKFFLDDQRIFLVNIDILLCVIIGLTIPSSIQCIHVCCHVRTMQAKLEAIWCEAKEKCNCMYSFAAFALYSSDSIHVVLFHSVLKMTTKSHILYWVSRQVLIT